MKGERKEPDPKTLVLREARAYLRWLRDTGSLMQLREPMRPENNLMKEQSDGRSLNPKSDNAAELEQLHAQVKVCVKCRLGLTRLQAVPGAGSFDADLMFIGEAPGATEDKTGLPFVGRAGNLLTQQLEKNGIRRDDVFIANIIKCRPPENRDPMPDEIASCEPYLKKQIELIRPRMLCGLGRYACEVLMRGKIKIMQIRGTWTEYEGVPLLVCLHPSAILHQPNNRHLFEQDIAALAERYRALPGR